jgi:hypothetical protein
MWELVWRECKQYHGSVWKDKVNENGAGDSNLLPLSVGYHRITEIWFLVPYLKIFSKFKAVYTAYSNERRSVNEELMNDNPVSRHFLRGTTNSCQNINVPYTAVISQKLISFRWFGGCPPFMEHYLSAKPTPLDPIMRQMDTFLCKK